jgi:hypothetical protein
MNGMIEYVSQRSNLAGYVTQLILKRKKEKNDTLCINMFYNPFDSFNHHFINNISNKINNRKEIHISDSNKHKLSLD